LAAWFERRKILCNPKVQASASSAADRCVIEAGNVALRAIDFGGIICENDTAITLVAIFNTGKGETSLLARSQARLWGANEAIKVDGIGQGAALAGLIGVAAQRLVRVNSDTFGIGESRVLPDGKSLVAATLLSLISIAGKGALGLVDLSTVDSGTTEADAVILKSSVTESIA